MSGVFRHSIIRRRPVFVDDNRGGVVATWPAEPDEATLTGWSVDAGDTSQDTANRDAASVAYTIRHRGLSVDLLRSDVVVLFGIEYEIEGDILKQPGPSPATSHVIVKLRRWEG